MKPDGRGRPKVKKAPAKAVVTRRVRRLVDYAHEGNMLEASTASGVAYATLRDLYNGKTVNPGIKTLERLSKAYGIHPSWFTDDRQGDEVPNSGLVVTLREMVPGPRGPVHREILIPLAAYPLPWVLGEGMLILERLPPSPTRPIIGEAEGDEANCRMADAVLGPLLVAEASGLLPPLSPPWGVIESKSSLDEHLRAMRHVGRMWSEFLRNFDGRQ
ncbi:MAG: helix-turn-helix domain-containing protein [Gemmatimonadales bacterium]|nr:helix-turn-helix domain-containing protein [Gemmatimonadales bacterium]